MDQEITGDLVEVTLKQGETLNFKYKTTYDKAAQIIGFLTKKATMTDGDMPDTPLALPVTANSKPAFGSAIEAVRDSGAQTYPQKIATLGQFIVSRDKRDTFDSKEILALLRRMGDTPRNFARDLRNAELLGYITKEQNGEYFLTSRATEEVESQFSNAISPSSTSKKKIKRVTEKTKGGNTYEQSASEQTPGE